MPNPQNSLSYAISSVTIYRNHCLPLKKKQRYSQFYIVCPNPWLLGSYMTFF